MTTNVIISLGGEAERQMDNVLPETYGREQIVPYKSTQEAIASSFRIRSLRSAISIRSMAGERS